MKKLSNGQKMLMEILCMEIQPLVKMSMSAFLAYMIVTMIWFKPVTILQAPIIVIAQWEQGLGALI